jgi:hypothetical protein
MTMKRQKVVTASELMQRLGNDPDWVRRQTERKALHEERVAALREAVRPEEMPLIADLASVGQHIKSVWDLVNTRERYPTAIPVLVEHLGRVHHPYMREGIARALTVPEARGIAGSALLQELVSQRDPIGSEARWALANALTIVADNSIKQRIESIIASPQFVDVHERLRVAIETLRKS